MRGGGGDDVGRRLITERHHGVERVAALEHVQQELRRLRAITWQRCEATANDAIENGVYIGNQQ